MPMGTVDDITDISIQQAACWCIVVAHGSNKSCLHSIFYAQYSNGSLELLLHVVVQMILQCSCKAMYAYVGHPWRYPDAMLTYHYTNERHVLLEAVRRLQLRAIA